MKVNLNRLKAWSKKYKRGNIRFETSDLERTYSQIKYKH
jgi:hypothetical protein